MRFRIFFVGFFFLFVTSASLKGGSSLPQGGWVEWRIRVAAEESSPFLPPSFSKTTVAAPRIEYLCRLTILEDRGKEVVMRLEMETERKVLVIPSLPTPWDSLLAKEPMPPILPQETEKTSLSIAGRTLAATKRRWHHKELMIERWDAAELPFGPAYLRVGDELEMTVTAFGFAGTPPPTTP